MSAVINLHFIRHMKTYQPYKSSRLRYESELAFENGDSPIAMKCDCGCLLSWGPGMDESCDECGTEYNSSGQRLRKDWQATCSEDY